MEQDQSGYTVYVIKNDGAPFITRRYDRKWEAMRDFRVLGKQYNPDNGHETCVYVGHDSEMIASNWPPS